MAVGNNNPYMGWASALGIAEEATYNTFVTATSFFEFNSEGFMLTEEELKLDQINSTRDYSKRLKGNKDVAGSIECDLNVAQDSNVLILKHAMGGTVSSATITASGAYEHTINPGDMESNAGSGGSNTPGLSFTVRRGASSSSNNVWTHSGGRINTLSIKGEVGSPVNVTAEIIAAGTSVTSTSPAISFTEVMPLNFTGVTVQTGDSITNVTTEYFTAFEFTLNNNLSPQRNLGNAEIDRLPAQRREVMLKLTQRFDTTTAYDRFIQNTMTAISIVCDSGQTIGAIATTYALTIKVPKGYYNSNQPQVGDTDALTHEIEMSGLYDSDAGNSVQMLVRNATANYA